MAKLSLGSPTRCRGDMEMLMGWGYVMNFLFCSQRLTVRKRLIVVQRLFKFRGAVVAVQCIADCFIELFIWFVRSVVCLFVSDFKKFFSVFRFKNSPLPN